MTEWVFNPSGGMNGLSVCCCNAIGIDKTRRCNGILCVDIPVEVNAILLVVDIALGLESHGP